MARTTDTPAVNPAGNNFFLTDGENQTSGGATLDYFIGFEVPVANLRLDLYDYRDGGPTIGDTATLSVFSDLFFTNLVGSDTFTVPSPLPVDGNVVTLSVLSPAAAIRTALVTFSAPDVGTGIDNVEWNFPTAVPEPGTLLLFGSGLVWVGIGSRKRNRRN